MSTTRTRRPGLLVLGLFLAQASCSFAFVKPAPPRRDATAGGPGAPPPLQCSSRLTAPVWDTIGAGSSLGLTLLWMATQNALDSDDPDSPFYNNEPTAEDRQLTLGLVALTAVYTASAIYGYMTTSECRERQLEQLPSVPRWPPQGPWQQPESPAPAIPPPR